jgi:DNA polymerase III delta prime subunit
MGGAMRKFNTAGPCVEGRHYMLDPLARLPEARTLIDDMGYFVVHAPRQTGKTTTLRALAQALVAEGRYAALHFSCEAAESRGADIDRAQQEILSDLLRRAAEDLPPELAPPRPWPPAMSGGGVLAMALATWAKACPRPLVLFVDEIDALRGQSLVSVLRQLRAGFADRPHAFPASVVLCGLRDVRDYKAAAGGDAERLGTSSPFNIKVESLRLASFTAAEVAALYGQHTAETGQAFAPAALARAFELSQGQPWLVNALARELTEKMGLAPAMVIGPEEVEEAKERLILARATHLDSLVARLMEPRVRRVIAPIVAGGIGGEGDTYDDDVRYVRDLGLLAPTPPLAIANPIYREVIVRVLAATAEEHAWLEPRSFVEPDGRLAVRRLLQEFASFWREHGEVLAGRMPYHEVAPQLVLMAFLQRVVNGGGYVDREYGIGRGRIDLLVRWPFAGPAGRRTWQREALELKVWAPGKRSPLAQGLAQLDGYLARLDLATGVLVLFDRRPEAPPIEERTRFESAATPSGRTVTVLWA